MSKLSIAGFTNLGFRRHARSFQPIDPVISGQTALVTGATGGLGLAISRRLASFGARVYLVGRSDTKLAAARELVGPSAVSLKVDLSSMEEVRRLADEVAEMSESLEILVNNVGVLNPTRLMTDEGLEMSLATNLAGHFILTNTLAPLLVGSSPSRVVNVTSGGMYSERIDPDDLQFETREYSGTAAYARTKRAQIILTEMWSERLAPLGVVVNSMHPGWARTAGVESSLPLFNRIVGPFLRTPEQGADTAIWLAADRSTEALTGQFWFDRRVAPTHLSERTVETTGEREALWRNLVALTSSDLDLEAAARAKASGSSQA